MTNGARFTRQSFRPTAMSLALASAGVIPAGHLVAEPLRRGLVRHHLDGANSYKSVEVAL